MHLIQKVIMVNCSSNKKNRLFHHNIQKEQRFNLLTQIQSECKRLRFK